MRLPLLLLLVAATAFLLAPSCTPSRVDQMQICAHEDDDTYFMNPSVLKTLAAGGSSWTVYLTAGDAGSVTNGHWQSRELGVRAAYAAMAGVANAWEPFALDVAGRSLVAFRLAARPGVKLVFLRLPDGNPGGTGYAATGFQSLEKLWTEPDGYALDSVEDAQSYTRAELVQVLSLLVAGRQPRTLRMQDPTGYHGSDHSDHVYGALFAMEAHLGAAGGRKLRAYRTYNTDLEPENLSAQEQADSRAIQSIYQAFDAGAGPNEWNDREIALGGMSPARGHLEFGGACLAASAASAGAAVGLAPCADVSLQRFQLRDDRRIAHAAGLCVATAAETPAAGGLLALAACSDAPSQRFTLFTDGHLRGHEDLCVVPLANGAGVTTCSIAARGWSLRASPPFAATADFSTQELGTDVARYGSLRLGDVDGDGAADACARRADGVWCALAAGDGSFAAATRWHDAFSDAQGWGIAAYGSTLMLGDLDGDARDDLCGRGAAGVWCALSTGAGFGAIALWTSAYSDAAGGGAAAVYQSLRLGDVDADGRDDLCAREGASVVCRRSTGAVFGAGETWIGNPWGALLALPASQAGRTLMLGDVDGDRAADLCERGIAGVFCAIADPAAATFTDPAMRSQGDFSDARGWSALESYWRSIRLGDLTGDGRADLCGRGTAGLLCLFSNDGRFSRLVHDVAPHFSNASGWSGVERGSTLQLGDVDGDGTADACGAGAASLDCVVLDGP